MTLLTANLTDLIGSAIEVILDDIGTRRPGIALSGGLDSSAVACIADAVHPGLPVFTGYYDEPGYDEREYSRLVVDGLDKRNGWSAWEIKITPDDFVANFDGMTAALHPLRCGMGAAGQYAVAKYMASQGIEVSLSGEGSDELFGGYARQMIVAGEAPPVGYEDYVLPEGYPADLEAALAYDYAALPALLAVDDQMAGAWNIEARAPFTDPRIVEYGLSLPARERVGKRHLRAALRGIVPDAIIDRTDKRGFPIPLVRWANEEPDVRSLVLDRIGYLPDPTKPYAREWWLELCAVA